MGIWQPSALKENSLEEGKSITKFKERCDELVNHRWFVGRQCGYRSKGRAQVEKMSQTFFSECAKKSNTFQVYVHFILQSLYILICTSLFKHSNIHIVNQCTWCIHRIIHISMVIAEGYVELGIWRSGQDVTLCASWRSDGKLLLVGEAGGSCVPWRIMTGKNKNSNWQMAYLAGN